MNEQQRAFERVLALIEEADCHRHLILVGSWVEFVYRESGVLSQYDPNIRTLDVDYLVRNLRKPMPPARLAVAARKSGFFVESDRLNGTTRFLDATGLEVEFLISKRGAGLEPVLETNVGVTAQALRHLELLSRHVISVFCLNHPVTVPVPEAYALQKMAINDQRGIKAEKDAEAVRAMWSHLNRRTMLSIRGELTKRERNQVESFMKRNGLSLAEGAES